MQIAPNTALLVIDVQIAINRPSNGKRNNPQAEENIGRLLAAWRKAELPIYHVKNDSLDPESAFHPSKPGNALMPVAVPEPGEPLIIKHVNSAFIGTDLEQQLRDAGITTLVMSGLVLNHCVETCARMANNLGFETYVVSDATATHERWGPDGTYFDGDLIHAVALASIHEEFVTVVDTDTVLAAVPLPSE